MIWYVSCNKNPLNCQKHFERWWPPTSHPIYIRFARPVSPVSKCLNVAGDPFKGNQDPSNIEGWELEMIEVESWRCRSNVLKVAEMWKWLKRLLLNIKWQVEDEFSCPSKVDFLQNCDFSSICAKVRRLQCKSALIVPFLCILLLPGNNHFSSMMTMMIKSYDDRYDKHCSW